MQQIHHRRRWLAVAVTVVTATVTAVLGITPNPAAAAGPACTVLYQSPPSWNWDGGFQADIGITNNGGPIDGWVLKWQFTGSQGMANAFNAYYYQSGQTVWASNMSFNSTIPAGATIHFGFIASGSTYPLPSSFYLNSDYPCDVQFDVG